MFETNVGIVDRIIRIVVGLALIAGYWIWPEASYRWAFFIGVIPLLSGIAGWCPVYRLLGWSTTDHSHNVSTRTKSA